MVPSVTFFYTFNTAAVNPATLATFAESTSAVYPDASATSATTADAVDIADYFSATIDDVYYDTFDFNDTAVDAAALDEYYTAADNVAIDGVATVTSDVNYAALGGSIDDVLASVDDSSVYYSTTDVAVTSVDGVPEYFNASAAHDVNDSALNDTAVDDIFVNDVSIDEVYVDDEFNVVIAVGFYCCWLQNGGFGSVRDT